MARCDFEVIDDDQDKPTENHMYMLQTLTSPELTRIETSPTTTNVTKQWFQCDQHELTIVSK